MTTALRRNKLFILLVFFTMLVISTLLSFSFSSVNTSAGAPTCTWTGAGGNTDFSTAGNWTCETGTVPVDGTTVIFPTSATNRVGNNNLSTSIAFSGIEFSGNPTECTYGSGYPYTFTGSFKIAGDIIDLNGKQCSFNSSGSTTTSFAGVTTLAANSSISTINHTYFPGGFNIGSYVLTLTKPAGYQSYEYPEYQLGSKSTVFMDAVTGSGTVNLDGVFVRFYAPSPSFTGALNMSGNGYAYVGNQSTLWTTAANYNQGLGTATITIADTSWLEWYFFSGFTGTAMTIPNNFVVSSAGVNTGGHQLALYSGDNAVSNATITPVLGATYREWYQKVKSGRSVALTGSMTLSTNLRIKTDMTSTTLSGALSGSTRTISVLTPDANNGLQDTGGSLIVNGSSNTTATSNGTVASSAYTWTLQSFNSSGAHYVGNLARLNLGSRTDVGAILLQNGGVLTGVGTIGALTSQSGKLAIGNSPGIINSGSVSFDSSSSMDVEIGGTGAGQYDQLNVTGTVSLGSATLNTVHYGGFLPVLNDTFTIISNDSNDAITGTFAGLAQGATFVLDDITYTISYVGGTGNDVVLTATTVPGPPDTAGALARPVNIAITGAVVMLGIGSLFLRKSYLKSSRRTIRTRK
ncbi:MAG: hypothetical protein WA030_04310 [Candidatus Microsaccharimonas sp.]